MRTRLGLSIGAHEASALIVSRGVIVWHAAVPVTDVQSIGQAMSALVATAPRRRQMGVIAAIGPSLAQVKQLAGIPAIRDARLLDQLARENATRFFLRGTAALTTTPVWHGADGAIWCAAFDTPLLREISGACSELGLQFIGAVPAAVAVGRATVDGRAHLQDGPVIADVVAPAGLPQTIRRRRAAVGEAQRALQLVDPLTNLGPDAFRFAAAYGAALSTARSPLVWRHAGSSSALRRYTRGVLMTLCVLAGLATLFAPGLRARTAASAARSALARTETRVRALAKVEGELRSVTADIDRIEHFAAGRRSMSRLMSGLAEALPESAAVVSLRVDTLGGTMVTLSRRAADIIPQLADVAQLASSQIHGTATREVAAGVSLERATIRFVLRPPRAAR